MPRKSKRMEYIPLEERRRRALKREALTLDELKKLSPKERREYMEKRKGVMGPSKKASKKRPKQFEKHRDPGAVERMMEFEKSLREAGFAKGGYANCGASVKPTQKSTKMMYGGMAKKKGGK